MNKAQRFAPIFAAVICSFCAAPCFSARAAQACSISVVVHSNGAIEFDGATIKDETKLAALLAQYHKQNPKCAVRVSGDEDIDFRAVGRVIFAMQKAGFLKVGFLTEPRNQPCMDRLDAACAPNR
jgi:biopolymer transport protein ExbD